MSYNYITDSHTNAVYKTTSPEGAKLIQRYMNQVGGSTSTDRRRHAVTTELWTTSEWAKPTFLRPGSRPGVRPISLANTHYHLTQAWLSVLDPDPPPSKLGLHVNKRLARLDVIEGLLNELPLENYNYGDISTEQQNKIGIIIQQIRDFLTENAGEIETELGEEADHTEWAVANPLIHQLDMIRKASPKRIVDGLSRATSLESDWLREVYRRTYEPLKVFRDDAMARRMEKRALRMAAVTKRRRVAKAASSAARKAAAVAKSTTEAVVVAALDKEFGPNMQAYNTVHDLTTSRTLARLDSLISAVRNSSLSDPFSKLGSPDFRPESLPIVVHDEDFTALISQADRSLMP